MISFFPYAAHIAAALMVILAAVLVVIIVSNRIKMRLGFEAGMGLIALGLASTGISMLEAGSCETSASVFRMMLIAGGVLVIIISIIYYQKALHHPIRRHSDFLGTQRTSRQHHESK